MWTDLRAEVVGEFDSLDGRDRQLVRLAEWAMWRHHMAAPVKGPRGPRLTREELRDRRRQKRRAGVARLKAARAARNALREPVRGPGRPAHLEAAARRIGELARARLAAKPSATGAHTLPSEKP